MCGITGVFQFGRSAKADPSIVASMRDSMPHRGPDSKGVWTSRCGRTVLGHRRLSIVDLSDSATQPMLSEDGSVSVVSNGEIYNHVTLREELVKLGHIFRSGHSDTEVLIHGYEQWGLEGLLERIEGDYAFGLWSERENSLSLARDRVGVKPLYFAVHRGAFIFASEIKAILAYSGFERDVNTSAMRHYLTFLTTPAPLTMFKGVFKLPAGCWMRVGPSGDISTGRYWDAVPGKGDIADSVRGLSGENLERFYVEEIRRRLASSVEKRMMSDAPYGAFLSGGIDSTANVALMGQFSPAPVKTFTVGFYDHTGLNELDEARSAARHFKTDHHEILIGAKEAVESLDAVFHHQDEPLADWVCIPLYHVSKLASSLGVKVVQVGEGADEQFCGYDGYLRYIKMRKDWYDPIRARVPAFPLRGVSAGLKALSSVWPRLEPMADAADRTSRGRELFWGGAISFWETHKNRFVNNDAMETQEFPEFLSGAAFTDRRVMEMDSYSVVRSFMEPFDKAFPNADILTRMIHNEFRLRLPELLLMRVDKMTMASSLEARVPFLDHKLVELTMDIPMEWKIKGGVSKYLLKKAVAGLVPNEIINRRKVGFGAPVSQWLRGPLMEKARDSVLGGELMKRGYFNRAYIERLMADHEAGKRDNALYVWTLFNLSEWSGKWIG